MKATVKYLISPMNSVLMHNMTSEIKSQMNSVLNHSGLEHESTKDSSKERTTGLR